MSKSTAPVLQLTPDVSLFYVSQAGDTVQGSLYARASYQYSVDESMELAYKRDNV